MSIYDQYGPMVYGPGGYAQGYNVDPNNPLFGGPPAVANPAPASVPAAAGNPPPGGVLSGQSPAAAGPLSGAGNAGGSFWNQQWIGPTAAALLGGRTLRDSLAGAAQAVAQTAPGEMQRQALNGWLQAKSAAVPDASGNVDPTKAAALNAAQTKLFQVDPQLAQNVASFAMTPHPMTIQQNSITGDVLGIDPYGVNPPKVLYSARQAVTGDSGGGGGSAAPSAPDGGVVAATPAGYDPAKKVNFSGLDHSRPITTQKQNDGSVIATDWTGRWAVQSGPEPQPEQTKAAGAAALARSAQNDLNATEASQTSQGQSLVRNLGRVGGFVTAPFLGPEGRKYVAAQNTFMEAIRGYAQGKGLSPEDPRFAKETFFAPDNANPEELATAAAHREAMIHEMETSAGPYVQPQQPAAGASTASAQEGQTARNPATGHVIVVKGGQWVDAQTGQPVQ